MLLIIAQEVTSGSFPTGEAVFLVLGILLGIVGTVLTRSRQRRGLLRLIDTEIDFNQERLQLGKLSALDTSEWKDNNEKLGEALRAEEFRLLAGYHHELDEIKSTLSAENAPTAISMGARCKEITKKYTTGLRRITGPLPRL